MSSILFSGCSIPYGTGLELEKNDSANYCNVFANTCFKKSLTTNISVPGNSNFEIFLSTSAELINSAYDYIFVGWTSYPRHIVHLGVEEYSTKRTLMAGNDLLEYNGNDVSFSSKYLNDVKNKFVIMVNDHYSILEIVQYVNILTNLAKLKKTNIYFINNYCSWDENYFTQVDGEILPSNLTAYTNKILNSNNRDDTQIGMLYNKMHSDYTALGSIQESLWLNLYQNINLNKIDVGSDGRHPGPQTHKNYGLFLADRLDKKF